MEAQQISRSSFKKIIRMQDLRCLIIPTTAYVRYFKFLLHISNIPRYWKVYFTGPYQ